MGNKRLYNPDKELLSNEEEWAYMCQDCGEEAPCILIIKKAARQCAFQKTLRNRCPVMSEATYTTWCKIENNGEVEKRILQSSSQ